VLEVVLEVVDDDVTDRPDVVRPRARRADKFNVPEVDEDDDEDDALLLFPLLLLVPESA
jgi:hypothetical protein